jgi:hypothetical protein
MKKYLKYVLTFDNWIILFTASACYMVGVCTGSASKNDGLSDTQILNNMWQTVAMLVVGAIVFSFLFWLIVEKKKESRNEKVS